LTFDCGACAQFLYSARIPKSGMIFTYSWWLLGRSQEVLLVAMGGVGLGPTPLLGISEKRWEYPSSWRRQWHPLQYSCLENPMDGGAWWAAVHGVAKSWTWFHFHFSLSCIGEGNGNLLQCSCLENPRDRGAWWAAIYGVTQSQTWLKRLSSSSSSSSIPPLRVQPWASASFIEGWWWKGDLGKKLESMSWRRTQGGQMMRKDGIQVVTVKGIGRNS